MKKSPVLFLLVILMQHATLTCAGGPMLTDQDCNPVVFLESGMPIPYSIDQGTLGLFSNSEAAAIVDDCFATWQAVATARVSFQNAGALSADVTQYNIETFASKTDSINPVIFDSDGGIIDSLYGKGASDNIIGFSGSSYDCDAAAGCHYTEGLSLLNGRFTQEPYNWGPALFKATFVHEFGHFIGLDHCQINQQYVHDDNTTNDIYIPTMFPTSTDDDTPLADLNPDDKAALTMLYPNEDSIVKAAYGRISGTLHWQSGLPVRGANVVAVKKGDELMSRFSSVSDYCMQGDGSFEMLVKPGTYSFFVEPIYPFFTGGSSVGPYAENALSLSFIFPVIATEYDQSVTVAAGKTQTVEFVARRNWLRPVPGLFARLLLFLDSLGLLSTAGN
jgi:hypothetical protein